MQNRARHGNQPASPSSIKEKWEKRGYQRDSRDIEDQAHAHFIKPNTSSKKETVKALEKNATTQAIL